MSLTRSSLALFGTRSLGVVIGFLAVVVFAREIGVAALGSYFLFQALLDVVALVTDTGLKSAVEKRISEGEPPDEVLGTGVVLKLLLLIVSGVVILALREPIAGFIGADLALPLVATAALRESGRLTTFTLRGERRVTRSTTVELLRKATYGVVGVGLAIQGFGVRAPVYGLLAGYAVMTLAGVIRLDTRPGTPSLDMARSLLSYSRYSFVSQLGGFGYSWVDVLVLGAFISPAAVGAYEVAWKVASIATMFSDALATAAFPRLSEYSGRGALERVESLVPKLVTPSLAVVIPAFFGSLVLSREILQVVFGQAYVGAALALLVLMADSVSSAVYKPVSRTLRALDRPDLDAGAVVAQVTLNLILNLVLVPRYGITGAAVATGLGALAGKSLALVALSRLMRVRFQWRAIGWSITAAAAMAAVVQALSTALVVETGIELAAVVGAGALVYAALALAAPPLRSLAVAGVSNVLADQ